MDVFISYSRKDEALAHLLATIIRREDIPCNIDRRLPQAQPFDENIKKSIMRAKVVLVLLTETSMHSPWVNQEVGFADANGKTIWPVAMEDGLEPTGMIRNNGMHSLFDWANPDQTIAHFIETLRDLCGKSDASFEASRVDMVLTDRIQRTRYLAGRLESLRNGISGNVEILNKAAFSIFAFSNDDRYGLAGHHTDEYMAALDNERTQMELLLEKPGVTLKLLLGPVRKYDAELQLVRFENLLEWLNSVRTQENIEVRYTRNHGDNRLIVPGEFVLEGHKGSHETGYRFNTVCFLEHSIKDAVKLFEREWCLARLRNEDAIGRIEELRDQILNGSAD